MIEETKPNRIELPQIWPFEWIKWHMLLNSMIYQGFHDLGCLRIYMPIAYLKTRYPFSQSSFTDGCLLPGPKASILESLLF